MTAFGVAVRWIQLACALSLVGIFALLLLAGRSDRGTARAWEGRVIAWTRRLVLALIAAGVATLGYQAAAVTDRAGALLEPAIWLRLLWQSHFGTVWLMRHAVVLLLAALVLLREREASPADWTAWRAESLALAAAGAAAMAWAGHAAAVEPGALAAALIDAVHIGAAGAWLGALWPLSALLRAASRESGADARPFAVLAVRRFSHLALVAMLIVVATGIGNAWIEVGSVQALVGTRYGRLLLLKLLVLAAVLVIAAMNRSTLPALSGEAATIGRPAMAQLARFVKWEGALALLILGVTSWLVLTPPGRHDSPYWPFAHRLAYDAMAGFPGVKARVVIGSQLAVLGALGLIIGALVKQRRGLIAAASAAGVVIGLWVALPPIAVDAYPTTYLRPKVPYQAASIDSGAALFAQHCAVCHGRTGTGDGPGGAGLPRPPADLTAPHTGQHTAGDLYWWLTHGIPASGMPAFSQILSEEDRWDVINYLRALSAGWQARSLTPSIDSTEVKLVAPDFVFSVGPTPERSLKALRGSAAVLLVLFSLPDSRARLVQLAEVYGELQFLGAEVIAMPLDADPRILSRLGGDPPILYPVATDGPAEIVPAYALFRRAITPDGVRPNLPMPRHIEFLIDRQGYLRARWIPGHGIRGWDDLTELRSELADLGREAPASLPEEHVH